MASLTSLKRSPIHEMEVYQGDEPTGIFIKGYGKASSFYRKAEAKHNPPKATTLNTKTNEIKFSPLAHEKQVAIAAGVVTGIVDSEGNPVDGFVCTPENVVELFTAPETEYIASQWIDFLNEEKKG